MPLLPPLRKRLPARRPSGQHAGPPEAPDGSPPGSCVPCASAAATLSCYPFTRPGPAHPSARTPPARGRFPPERNRQERHDLPADAPEDQDPGRLHRRARPERRQHAQGAARCTASTESEYSGDEEMFDVVHEMRTRIITSPAFGGDRILGAILFENTMDREIEGKPTADYLWNVKQRRAVPQGRQGPRRRGGRRAAHEADARSRRAADARQGQRHLRHQDALGHQAGERGRRQGRRRPAVRDRPADPRGRPRADHRARGRHPQPGEGRGRGAAQGSTCSTQLDKLDARPAGDAQADAARGGRLLRRLHQAHERAARGGALGRLLARGGQRAPRPQQRHGRQLLARADRGPERPADRGRVRRRRWTSRSRASSPRRRREPERTFSTFTSRGCAGAGRRSR